jgi:hypothetical protein
MSRLRDAIASNAEGTFLQDCTLLGGHGHSIAPGTACTVLLGSDEAHITPTEGEPVTFRYKELDSLEIGGRGLLQPGGGFIRGGFGAEGAVLGMGIASVLNSLTSKSSIETVLTFKTRRGEAWVHYPRETPQALNIRLSGVLAKVERSNQEKPIARTASVTEELARLHELHVQRALTDEEYAEAKARLIERL